MNNLISITDSSVLTMSSREIAELTGSTHDNVLKTIRSLIAKGVVSGNETPYTHPQNGQTYQEFRLSYRDTMVVVSGYSVELRAKIIDRWQELEAQPSIDYTKLSKLQILQLAMESEQERLALEHKVEELSTKAEALDLISADKDTLTITEVAKILGMKMKDLTARLNAEGWVYRRNGAWVAYDRYIKNGCLTYKEAKYTDGNTGQELRKPYCHVTPKGLTKLATMFSVELEPA